jgi:hypothetical protein
MNSVVTVRLTVNAVSTLIVELVRETVTWKLLCFMRIPFIPDVRTHLLNPLLAQA